MCDNARRRITAEETQQKGGRKRGGPEKEGIRRTEQVHVEKRSKMWPISCPLVLCALGIHF